MAKPNFYDTDETIKTQGQWTWKDSLLWRKVVKTTPEACWAWLGSTSPHANLFGARKNDRPQMTQVPRLLWASIHEQDIEDLEIRHTCGNRFCCNPHHLYAVPNHMLYRRDGTDKTLPPESARLPRTVQAQPLEDKQKRWWQL